MGIRPAPLLYETTKRILLLRRAYVRCTLSKVSEGSNAKENYYYCIRHDQQHNKGCSEEGLPPPWCQHRMDLRLHDFKACNEKRLVKPPDDGESPEMIDDGDSVGWTVSSSLLEILVPSSSPPEPSSAHKQPARTTRSHDPTGAPGDGGSAASSTKGYRRQTWPRGPSASAAGASTATVDVDGPEETTPVERELEDGGKEDDEMRHDCRIDMHPYEHCEIAITRVVAVNSLSYSRSMRSSPKRPFPSGNVYRDGGLATETSPTEKKTSHMNVKLCCGDVMVTIPPRFQLGELHAAAWMQWKGIKAILRESCVL